MRRFIIIFLRLGFSLSIAQELIGDAVRISRGLEACVDADGQISVEDNMRTCQWIRQNNMTNACGADEIRNFCRLTCDACADKNIEYEDCIDSRGKVLVGDRNRTCLYISKNNMTDVCANSNEIMNFCPFTCEACGDEKEIDKGCVDSRGRVLVGDRNRTCLSISKNNMTYVCDDSSEISDFCPLTCNTCEGRIEKGCKDSRGKVLVGERNRTCRYIWAHNMTDVCDNSSEISDFCPVTCNTCEGKTGGGCADSRGKVLVGDKNRTCRFIWTNNMTNVCNGSLEISTFCPRTCNACSTSAPGPVPNITCETCALSPAASMKIRLEVNVITAVGCFYLAMVMW